MGCDIHLKVERRFKVNPYPLDKNEWRNVSIYGQFSNRCYEMFARMAKVRAYNKNYEVQFEPRGLPDDITDWNTIEGFYLCIIDDEKIVNCGNNCCLREKADEWVSKGYSEWFNDNHSRVSDPDLHSHSWLTTKELRQCFDDCFKQENGTIDSSYIDWLGLVSLCEGIESTGEYEVRVVFAFDN